MSKITVTYDTDKMQLVPKEPTGQMLAFGCEAGLSVESLIDNTRFSSERAMWKAMLENAPDATS